MDVDKLITLVQSRENLYDPTNKDYMDRDVRENACKSIAVNMGFPGEMLLFYYGFALFLINP